MRSCTTEDGTTFHHNGDYSGDIIIQRPGFGEITVPFKGILQLVANYIRQERISQLEQAEPKELLNVSLRR